MVKSVLPDVILIDYAMPGMNGVETCIRLRQINETKKTPVVLCSAHQLDDAGKSKDMFNAYVKKPFSISSLMDKIEEFLPRSH